MRTFLLSIVLAIAAVPATAAAATPADTFANLDEKAKSYFTSQGILEGSLDGSVYLASNITRAEFVRAVTQYVYPAQAISPRCLHELDTDKRLGISYTLLFRDVSKNEPYALHLCAAMRGGMIWGYADGNFRPDATINLAEAAKVISVAFNLDYHMPDYQTDDWYGSYLHTVRQFTDLPAGGSPAHTVTIGDTRTMLQNIGERLATRHGSRVNERTEKRRLVSTSSVQ